MRHSFIAGGLWILIAAAFVSAEVTTTVERNEGAKATPEFKFKNVPAPAQENAARQAKVSIVSGERDEMGGELDKVNDGKLPTEEDQPAENFFFAQGIDGGRLLLDLGKAIRIKQVNTYSWHTDTRAPQVYRLYSSDGSAAGFDPHPRAGTNPVRAGWKLIATIDTRPKTGDPGGQYGVSIADSNGAIGQYRYLLFDISRTEDADPFGNTFFSEINVIEAK